MERGRAGRRNRRATGWDDLAVRLDRLEARMERLESGCGDTRGGTIGRRPRMSNRACCDDLIGCLDDCVDDVKELQEEGQGCRARSERWSLTRNVIIDAFVRSRDARSRGSIELLRRIEKGDYTGVLPDPGAGRGVSMSSWT